MCELFDEAGGQQFANSASIPLEKELEILDAPLPEKAADLYLMSAEPCEVFDKSSCDQKTTIWLEDEHVSSSLFFQFGHQFWHDVIDVYQFISAYETHDADKAKQLLTSSSFLM